MNEIKSLIDLYNSNDSQLINLTVILIGIVFVISVITIEAISFIRYSPSFYS